MQQHAQIRQLALENLQSSPALNYLTLGDALLDALVQSGADLKSGPSLEEIKTLLAEIAHTARRPPLAQCDHTAA